MQKFVIGAIVVFLSVAAQAQEVAWVVRPPTAGVKQGETARIEFLAVNALDKTMPIAPPVELSGDIGETGERGKIALKRVGEPPKFVPAGGFVVVSYDAVIPPDAGVGERVLRVKAPIEVSGILKILPAAPTTMQGPPPVVQPVATTGASSGLTLTPTTTTVVGPVPLSPDEAAKRVPTTSDSGTAEFIRNKLSPYERMYFLYGNEAPSAKFQISFKYKIVNDQSDMALAHPWMNGFYLAYTQTSFWDITADSAPAFFDNTYRPEFFWATNDIRLPDFPDKFRFDFQTGVQHESNGKGGDDSRTINAIYLQPAFTLGDKDALFITFAPRGYIYISSLADNPDITHYRGYFDLKLIMGQADGFQAAFTGRVGDDWDKGSLQLDLSYPLRKFRLFNWIDMYAHAQVFTGYGESLLRYNENDTTFRFGVSLVR